MPRVIILVPSAQHTAHTLAQSVADGAERVRFTEVERRTSREILEGIASLSESDGVIVTTFSGPDADAELLGILTTAERDLPRHAFKNTVFAVIGAGEAEWLPLIARLGGIIVSAPRGSDDPEERARALGERVATVVEWVRHARSHEHGHAHHDSHHHHH